MNLAQRVPGTPDGHWVSAASHPASCIQPTSLTSPVPSVPNARGCRSPRDGLQKTAWGRDMEKGITIYFR